VTKRGAPSGEKEQTAKEKALLEFARRASLTGALPASQNLVTSKEVAAALKVSQRTLSYWTDAKAGRRPRLAFVKLGRAKRFVVADILRFIEEQKYRSA
jgi:hypothetical protein